MRPVVNNDLLKQPLSSYGAKMLLHCDYYGDDQSTASFGCSESDESFVVSHLDDLSSRASTGGTRFPLNLTALKSSCCSDQEDDELEFVPEDEEEKQQDLKYFEGLSGKFQDAWFDKDEPRQKKFRFELGFNQYHGSSGDNYVTEEELRACWYSREELHLFENNTMAAAKNLYAEETGTRKNEGEVFSWTSSNHSTAATEESFGPVQHIHTAYQACCREGYGHLVNREELMAMYIQCPDLCGLEELLLHPIRGGSHGLVRFTIQESGRRQQSISCPLRDQEIIAHVSRSVSRPSSLLACELALAQAKALEVLNRRRGRRGSRTRDTLSRNSSHSRRTDGRLSGSRHREALPLAS